jgi:hypothetical protein
LNVLRRGRYRPRHVAACEHHTRRDNGHND